VAKRAIKTSKNTRLSTVKNPDVQKWLLNLAIFCLAIVIIGFIFSTGERFLVNSDKIELSQSDEIQLKVKPYSYIIVEVLNGCGTAGLAQKFTNYLRQQGFDVIYTGNADKMDYPMTHILERTDSPKKKKNLLNTLEFENKRARQRFDPTLHVDFTLILGNDYNRLSVYTEVLNMREHF